MERDYGVMSDQSNVPFLGHSLGDDRVDWNSGVSVRPSVRPQKVFPISI